MTSGKPRRRTAGAFKSAEGSKAAQIRNANQRGLKSGSRFNAGKALSYRQRDWRDNPSKSIELCFVYIGGEVIKFFWPK